ncbi:hypothetical protein [Perlucidibaca aquatica]|uniref:hypothetical protein n=1 Tax=Perlucidibaca aquatica TaxID=1852776 RepID=UPI00083B2E60|nr:hypothetical protein [Perlucidibaca aquatica]
MTALLLTLAALSIWLYQDAQRRQMNSPGAWVVLLCLLGPVALAAYWATRPLYQGEVRVGGRGWIMMRVFVVAVSAWAILFAAVFSVWLSAFMPLVAIFALFIGLGLFFAGGWVFVVALLLLAAWLIRDGQRVEVGPTHAALMGVPVPTYGDRLLKVIFLMGLLSVFIFTEPSHPEWIQESEWQSMPERLQL